MIEFILPIITILFLVLSIVFLIIWISHKNFPVILIGITGGIFLISMILSFCIVIVPAGSVGVVNVLGNVADTPYPPGLHLKNPLADIIIMGVKTQESSNQADALSSDGLTVHMDLTVLYRLNDMSAPTMFKTVGENYPQIVVEPSIRSAMRDIIAGYSSQALYNESERNALQVKIEHLITPMLAKRGVTVEQVLMRSVNLPDSLKSAIESKMAAQQKIQQKEYEVSEARQEAERKRVEAQGISDSNKIISNSLTESYLKWYWIQEIGNRNGDTYYIPVGSDGLPVMKAL